MLSHAIISAALLSAASALALPQSTYPTANATLSCGATSVTNYTIAGDDTLSSVATQFNSGICDIAKLNNISNPNFVFAGEVLQVPTSCTDPDNTSCLPPAAPAATATCAVAASSAYIVRSGDYLSLIAGNYNITLDALVAANPQISNIDLIYPNDLINIPICAGSQCLVKTYTVKSGDTFYDLSKKIGTTVGNVEGVNLNVDPTALAVNQTILLPTHCKINA